MKLKDKIAIITGAGSGIGRETALLFASEGAKVVIADRNAEAGQRTAEDIRRSGGTALWVEVDVSKSEDVRRMVDTTIEKLGPPDILHNNAGIEGRSAFLAQMSEDAFDEVIAINLRGVWLGMKYVLPYMVERRSGAIINTASVAGLVALKTASAYCAAKAGVISLTRVAALEYARYNIRVNCICPGLVDTPMTARVTAEGGVTPNRIMQMVPLNRPGHPSEIARAALFLASDESSYITGAQLVVDGGWTIL